jgi:hypothetical protein
MIFGIVGNFQIGYGRLFHAQPFLRFRRISQPLRKKSDLYLQANYDLIYRADWYNGKGVDLYSGSARFEFRREYLH